MGPSVEPLSAGATVTALPLSRDAELLAVLPDPDGARKRATARRLWTSILNAGDKLTSDGSLLLGRGDRVAYRLRESIILPRLTMSSIQRFPSQRRAKPGDNWPSATRHRIALRRRLLWISVDRVLGRIEIKVTASRSWLCFRSLRIGVHRKLRSVTGVMVSDNPLQRLGVL